MLSDLNPMAPDAPLISLLSVRSNPMLADASEADLVELVKKLRQHASSPQTIAAADAVAGAKVAAPRKLDSKAAAKKAMLDSL